MKNKKFPLYIDITMQKIVVVGGGKIAERRIKTLLEFTYNVVVVAPEVTGFIQDMAQDKKVIWKKKKYDDEDIKDADIVLGATNDEEVNDQIYRVCKGKKILVNISSDQNKCDFHFPGIIQYDEVVIGVNSGGKNHKQTKKIREKIEDFLKKGCEATDE